MVLCGALAGAALTLVPLARDEELARALPERSPERGYTSSTACLACHPDQYDSWHRSYHRTMTQIADPTTVMGNFDGVVLEDRGFRWRLERRADELWVVMPDPAWFEEPPWLMQALDARWPDAPPVIEARVVMTTGSHHMQAYWVRRPARGTDALPGDDGSLVQLPWVWLIDEERWVPNQDSFLTPPSGSVAAAGTWNANCSQCHSVSTVPGASERYDRFETRAVELGIACEACHGPAEEHTRHYRSPVKRYLRHFQQLRGNDGPDPTIVNPAKLDRRRSLEVCGQCHSFGAWRDEDAYRQTGVPFQPGEELDEVRSVFRYTGNDPGPREIVEADPLALEGRFWRDGTIRVAGREYNAMLADVHYAESDMTCLSCHSLHEYTDPDAQLASVSVGDAVCLTCHTDLAAGVTEHTRHEVGSPGSACMNCHMPHTTYGLFQAMRSHRIDSPSVRVSVETGRPNACNLCHLDRTLEWTTGYLSEWYGQAPTELGPDERSIAAAALWTLKGDAAQRTVLAWHFGWAAARAASGESWMVPYLAQLLTDPYAATRQVAYRSLRTLRGFETFEYDYLASPPERALGASTALGLWHAMAGGAGGQQGERLLMDEDGLIEFDIWQRLLAARDERPLTIRE